MKEKFCQAILQDVEGEKMFIASDETLDRQGEVISVDGWDLEDYKANPVVLAYHDQNQPMLGFAKKIGYKTIDGKKRLVYQPEFHGETELSRFYKVLAEKGYPLASSVGFMPLDMEDTNIKKAKLLEISIVNVPANPSAMSLGYSKGIGVEAMKQAFGDNFAETEKEYKLKTLEEENAKLKAENEELTKKISAASEKEQPKPALKTGRKAKLVRTQGYLALKVLNKAIEDVNIAFKK